MPCVGVLISVNLDSEILSGISKECKGVRGWKELWRLFWLTLNNHFQSNAIEKRKQKHKGRLELLLIVNCFPVLQNYFGYNIRFLKLRTYRVEQKNGSI